MGTLQIPPEKLGFLIFCFKWIIILESTEGNLFQFVLTFYLFGGF